MHELTSQEMNIKVSHKVITHSIVSRLKKKGGIKQGSAVLCGEAQQLKYSDPRSRRRFCKKLILERIVPRQKETMKPADRLGPVQVVGAVELFEGLLGWRGAPPDKRLAAYVKLPSAGRCLPRR